MGKSNYYAYLTSAAWRTKRLGALNRADGRCERCSSNERLHVHHKTYKRLGVELPEDLEVLCAPCHKKEHAKPRRKAKAKPKIVAAKKNKKPVTPTTPKEKKLAQENDALHAQLAANRARRERTRDLMTWNAPRINP